MPAEPATSNTPTLGQLGLAIGKIGLTSFGGGLSGWMLREFVQRRRWMTEDDFLTGLALAQVFPGVNVVNLSIWIGYRMRGGIGALVGACCIILPPGVVIVVIATLLAHLMQYSAVHVALAGIAAAAIGLSLQMGLRAARRCLSDPVAPAIMAAAFIAVGMLRWPMLPVVLVLAPISIALAARRMRKTADAH